MKLKKGQDGSRDDFMGFLKYMKRRVSISLLFFGEKEAKMKTLYHLGDDLFIAISFVSFTVSGVLKLLGIQDLFWGITTNTLLNLSIVSLLFSIALSLYDIAHGRK